MKKRKMGNKGFSLVELIVVILIMAVLAVSLAPQVMKWVDNARLSRDSEAYQNLIYATSMALNDSATYNYCMTNSPIIITMSDTGLTITGDDASKTIWNSLENVLGTDIDANPIKSQVSGGTYVITINNGAIERTTPPIADANMMS